MIPRQRFRYSLDVFLTRRSLSMVFTLLILLIIGGNSLIVWQFRESSSEIEKLTSTVRQLSIVLKLQQSLLSLHQRLDELAQAEDWVAIEQEAPALSENVIDQAKTTRVELASRQDITALSSEFLPTLDAIELSVPAQVNSIVALAKRQDGGAVESRLEKDLQPLETQSSFLVDSLDRKIREEMEASIANVRPLQRRIFFLVSVTAFSTFLIAMFFGWAMTLRMANLSLEERLEERTRIGRELHDTLMQTVEGCRFIAEAIAGSENPASANPEVFANLAGLLRRASDEGRAAMETLRPRNNQSGDLYLELERFVQDLNSPNILRIEVRQPRTVRVFRPGVRAEVYRICCEAIRNAFHHASASLITVTIEQERDLRISIQDDGVGIPQAILASGKHRHYGLQGMNERAEKLGGTLSLDVESGTLVGLVVPEFTAFERLSVLRMPSRR